MRIYVASSWRNDYQPEVVRALRELGHEVYDYRHPAQQGPNPGSPAHLEDGFRWTEIDEEWKHWTVGEYIEALEHPIAVAGFTSDFDAMKWADVGVLVMPCGRSAHLEAGYFVGANKPLLILASPSEPELMYKMADSIHAGLGSLLMRLQFIEDKSRAKPCPRCWQLRDRQLPEMGVVHANGGYAEHLPQLGEVQGDNGFPYAEPPLVQGDF